MIQGRRSRRRTGGRETPPRIPRYGAADDRKRGRPLRKRRTRAADRAPGASRRSRTRGAATAPARKEATAKRLELQGSRPELVIRPMEQPRVVARGESSQHLPVEDGMCRKVASRDTAYHQRDTGG